MELIAEPAVLTAVAAAGRERLLSFVSRAHGGVRLYTRPGRAGPRAGVFLEPLQGGELVYLQPGNGGRPRLHSFVPQRVWPGIRSDLGRTLHALAFLELFNGILAEGEPHGGTFELLVGFLNRLEQEGRPGLARLAASLRLLAAAGFAPCLDGCISCRRDIDVGRPAEFSAESGGVMCRDCRRQQHLSALPISPAALGLLRRAVSLPEGRMRRLRVPPAVEREASRLLEAFVEARTGVRPRAGGALGWLEAV